MVAVQEPPTATKPNRKSKGAKASRLTAPMSLAAGAYSTLEEAQGPLDNFFPPELTTYPTLEEAQPPLESGVSPEPATCPTLEEAQPPEDTFRPPEPTPKRTNLRVTKVSTPPVAPSYPESWRTAQEPAAPVPSPPKEAIPPAKQAEDISLALIPSMMADALKLDQFFDCKGYRAYLDQVRTDAGAPTDPIEIMMIEQLVMAHFRAAQLQGDAGQAQSLEAIRILNSASARLLGEFRLTALALEAYRAGRQKSVSPPDAGAPAKTRHRTGKYDEQEPHTRRSRSA